MTSRVNDGGKDIKEYKYLTEEEYEAKMKKEAVEDESVGVDGVVEVSDDEVEKQKGNMIVQPKNSKSLEQYNVIVEHLSNKRGQWVKLSGLRDLFRTEKSTKINIGLHDVECEYGDDGLVWRQIEGFYKNIEYCLN